MRFDYLAYFALGAGVAAFLTWRLVRPRPSPFAAPPAAEVLEPGNGPEIPGEGPAETLQRLSESLETFGEKTTHPRDFLLSADFGTCVDLLARPSTSLETVRQYALGRIWTLACAALEALRRRPDRQDAFSAIQAQLASFPPATLHFVLRYFDSLEQRPPVGAPVLMAQPWWANHTMLTESFREHFAACDALGDPPTFGGRLGAADVSPDTLEDFLRSVDHPTAGALRAELKAWKAVRVDDAFLTGFGRFLSGPPAELLVEPDPWRDLLARAEAAVLDTPPRSVLVTGGPRIGKSSFLRLLAERLKAHGWRVFEASGPELMAGQKYFGELEGRIRQTVAELDAGKRVAWSVGDLAQLARSGTHQGQSASVLDQLLPAVTAGRLLILAEAETDAASRAFQTRPALRMHLELCALAPFEDRQLRDLAVRLAAGAAEAQGLAVSPGAIDAVLHYALQYLGAAHAPGVVADVVKRAVQKSSAAAAPEVTAAFVVDAVSQITGIPGAILDDRERVDLAQVRRFFTDRIIGQDEAVSAVVDRVAMLKAGLVDPGRPIGVFLFAGPTGTGKTELAKSLAEYLFGSPDRMARLDMSEFQHPDSLAKIVGERGGRGESDSLVERIRKQPFSVVLLDEFEKAHSQVWDLFLQVFDDGRLTDANGHVADFRHTIIILTSNLGSAGHTAPAMGFNPGRNVFTDDQVITAVNRAFRPEFVNRLDRIVVFQPLSRQLMNGILRKELDRVLDRRGFKSRDWAVEWEPSALDFLLDRGFSPSMGARPLKRAIDQFLLAPLAATLVEHRFPQGDQFLFVRSNGKAIEVEFLDPNADPSPAPETTKAAPASDLTLPRLILHPAAGQAEQAFLAEAARRLEARLSADDWTGLKQSLAAQTASPDVWERPDRAAVFARLALMDRVREAAGTVQGLARRLGGGARDIAGRLALQIYLTDQGVSDALEDQPIDAVLAVDAAVAAGADAAGQGPWRLKLVGMYQGWAERRRMQVQVVEPRSGQGSPLLLVTGFGAYRTLAREAGLHILEERLAPGEVRRTVARVRVAAGPPGTLEPAHAFAALSGRLAAADEPSAVVRRYRESPSALVRDGATGGRHGNLDEVLAGDFDLIFAAAEATEPDPAA